MIDLKNKIILVTGGSGLLGSSILNNIREHGGIAINLDLKFNESRSKFNYECDITNNESFTSVINTITKKYLLISGFVNNAYPRTKDWHHKFEDIEYKSWQKNIDMQLNSVFITTQCIAEIMKKQKFGSIVNIGSIYGSNAPDFNIYNGTELTMPAAYSAIKGAVINFSKYLSSYYGKYGVRINTVSPGGILNNQSSIFINNYLKRVPLNRMANPDDISPMISFLLSDNSSYLTGQNIIIDGGLTVI